jgi:hypothetical protein
MRPMRSRSTRNDPIVLSDSSDATGAAAGANVGNRKGQGRAGSVRAPSTVRGARPEDLWLLGSDD